MAWTRAAALALSLVAASARAGEAPAPPTPEQLAHDVRAREDELAKLREQATSVLDELGAAEDEVAALQDAAEKAEGEARAVAARVALAQRDEDASRGALIAELDELAPRLLARYELGRQHRANLLLSATSLGELLWRQRALDRILDGDLALLARARAAVDKLADRRHKLESVRQEYGQRSLVAQDKRSRATRRKAELAALHDSLLSEQDLKEKTLKELYKQQSALTHFVAELRHEHEPEGAAAPAHPAFPRRKGHMPFPAQGMIEVGFGKVLNPKFNTVTFQKGVDIRAAEGSQVLAVASGKVVHAGPFRGYGNLVIVDHGDNYHSLYAHLGALGKAVGEAVDEGEALGTVGDTGSLKGAYLYFEIREKGKPIDPRPWLGAPRSP